MAQPASSPSHRFRTEWIALSVFLLIIGLAFVQALYREHISIEEHEGARLLGQAKVIDENLTRQLQGVNFALKAVRDDLESGSSAPEESDKLKLLSDAMPGVGGLAVLDAS